MRIDALAGRTMLAVSLVLATLGFARIASAGNLFSPTQRSEMRDLSTDRPNLTESPFTVDGGHFQLEWDLVSYALERAGGAETRVRSLSAFNFKVGLNERMDLEVLSQPWVRVAGDRFTFAFDSLAGTFTPRSPVESEYRFSGPTQLRLKFNVAGQGDGAPVSMALIPFLTVYGGDREETFYGLAIPISRQAGERFTLGGMVRATAVDTELLVLTTGVASVSIVPSLDLFLELAGERVGTTSSSWGALMDAGFAWRPLGNLQLDTAVAIGLTGSAPDWTTTTGLTVRR